MAETEDQVVVLFKTDRTENLSETSNARPIPPNQWNETQKLVAASAQVYQDGLKAHGLTAEVAVLFEPEGCVWYGGQIYC